MALATAYAQNVIMLDRVDTVHGYQTDNELIATLRVVNNATKLGQFVLTRTVISEPQGTSNYFCWGDGCYPSHVSVSNAYPIGSGDTTKSDECLRAYYNPIGVEGMAVINYKIKDLTNDDSTSHTLVFNVTRDPFTGITDVNANSAHQLLVKYQGDGKWILYNIASEDLEVELVRMNGQKVREFTIEGNDRQPISLSWLAKGVYVLRYKGDTHNGQLMLPR